MRTKYKIEYNTKGSLHFLYNTVIGRILLKILTLPIISKIVGNFMNSKLSVFMIKPFIKNNNIDKSQFEDIKYSSYNNFFTRKIIAEKRPIDMAPNAFIAPCDSKLTAYKIDDNSTFYIKDSHYTLYDLIKDNSLAQKYIGGTMLIFRLSVDDYHRYCYIDNGFQENNIHIKGILHTVQPIALKKYNIYKTNSREFTVLHTQNFGDIIQIEVGALLVGKIQNINCNNSFAKGEEKGYFEFGGSTICLILKKDSVIIDDELFINTELGYETQVKLGEKIGGIFHATN